MLVEINFHTAKEFIPDFEAHKDDIAKLKRPRLIKSHSIYNPNFNKVIYIVRDVRDVYISYYHYLKKTFSEEKSLSQFILEIDSKNNNWGQHINSWKENKLENIIFIKYEDLLSDTFGQVKLIVDFLGLKFNNEQISIAIDNSSFDKMSKIEEKYGRPFLNEEHKNKSTKFVRSGKQGEWKKILSEQDINSLKSKHFNILKQLEYIN